MHVEEDRELRGLWVAVVGNLDFPGPNRAPAAARARLEKIVDTAARAGLNAIFFHVRPESDALYRSTREPWSRELTGTQGNDPGYDPLGILLELAHARGIEVHAWVNPYRAVASKDNPVVAGHVAKVLSQAAITYGGSIVMDPGAPEVRTWVLGVVDDLLAHYAVDGLHYDDYFYPYPGATPFPDDRTYNAYVAGGGQLPRKLWRVENVNAMVRETGELVKIKYPTVRFGISPFGVFRPDPALGITGLDAYDALGCDAPRWLAEGWTDYVAPQLYWPTTKPGQAFGTLASFWARQATPETQIFLGQALYLVGTEPSWSFDELATQVAIGRGLRASGVRAVGGNIFFRAANLEAAGRVEQFATRLFPRPALSPELPRIARLIGDPDPPTVQALDAAAVQIEPEAVAPEFRALYAQSETGARWELVQVVSGDALEVVLPGPGVFALSNVAAGSVESRAVVLRP